jgi:hypothetical protein
MKVSRKSVPSDFIDLKTREFGQIVLNYYFHEYILVRREAKHERAGVAMWVDLSDAPPSNNKKKTKNSEICSETYVIEAKSPDESSAFALKRSLSTSKLFEAFKRMTCIHER